MTPRVIAVAQNYLGLVAAVRARLGELGINYATLDVLAGWTETYSTKLLSEEPSKHFGPMSLDAVMGALAFDIALIENPARLEHIQNHRDFVPRRRPMRIPGANTYVVRRDTREFMRQMSMKAAVARKKISPKKRSASARKAAKARWKYRRTAEAMQQFGTILPEKRK